ncbi:redoxin domain-containing protein [Gramella jeungdoensis]|uniref:Redoxin domain-containing protein n=1 Tax=Gramella jeungdoensis TaxID=708091 RepID=A0ABT0Z2Q0_9FLAO|nr:redoxin domain-containing protein [Gramella jeungdoensis]MCM8570008.1 redoxin domain-containing protein [Gramella jeungdoensis]
MFLIFSSASTNSQESIFDVKVQTLGGIEVKVEDIIKTSEEPVILFTYFNNCEVCIGSLDRIHKELKNDGIYGSDKKNFRVMAVNVSEPSNGVLGIKEFALKKQWTFDIYMDPDENIRKFLQKDEIRAPYGYVFLGNKVIHYKLGWVDENPAKTAKNLINAARSIGSPMVYYDADWNYTDAQDYVYFRTVDHWDDLYIVQDRWKSGKLQMRGQYKDKELTLREGHFIWFSIYGRPIIERDFKDNIQLREKLYYPNGQLLSDIEYKDGKVYNIHASFSPEGEPFDKGTIKDGTGSVILYNDWGNKVRKYYLNNGIYEGEWIEYKSDGSVSKKYKYQNSEWVEI